MHNDVVQFMREDSQRIARMEKVQADIQKQIEENNLLLGKLQKQLK